MPYLKIQSNVGLTAERRTALLGGASKRLSELLGKSEDYVMVAVEDGLPMCFAGSDAGTAYLELHSIGLDAGQAKECVAALCPLVGEVLGVDPGRIYVNCQGADRTMWGWNGDTFG